MSGREGRLAGRVTDRQTDRLDTSLSMMSGRKGRQIDFKIATLTYKALSSGQPAYLWELISPYKPSRQLRSSDQSLLTIPRTNLTIGQRAFSWSSVFILNSIPLSVRNAPTISTFKRRLKTFYFSSISS